MIAVTCVDCGTTRELAGHGPYRDRCSPCAHERDGKQRRAQTPGPWAQAGLCAQTDPEVFFPEKGQRGRVAQARAICRRCTVTEQCLDFALDTDQEFGIYAGLTVTERRALKRRQEAA